MNKGFLLLVVLIIAVALVLCACVKQEEIQKVEEIEGVDVVDVENSDDVYTDRQMQVLEDNEENRAKFMVDYKGVKFSTGVQIDLIKESLGQEIRPSDTSKACNPNAKGETTHYYYEGLTINVNYEGRINEIFIDSDTATLRSGIKVGMSPEEVKAIIPEVNEDPYSLNYNVGADFYSSMIKSDEGTISSISIGDMSIED